MHTTPDPISGEKDAGMHDRVSDIAIIGLAGRFPGARNIDQFWHNLQNGIESVSFFSDQKLAEAGIDRRLLGDPSYVKAKPILDDVELFDAEFFGISPREAELMDPQHRMFLECAWEALEDAGYPPATYPGRIGVYAGAEMNTYLLRALMSDPAVLAGADSVLLATASDKDYLCTRASYKLNLKGPSITIQTACSTSLVAVHLACEALLNGEADMALAGAVSLNLPQISGYQYLEGGVVSPDGHCRAFDAGARGTIFGSGLGLVVLKRLQNAVADGDSIRAIIKGSAINNDGSVKIGYTAPSVEGQALVVLEALEMAGINPETISYVEAHGTGTPLGDPIEITALSHAYRRRTAKKGYCAIGSVKTNIGHLAAAAGVASLIKTALALEHQLLPASLHFERPNPQIDFKNSPFYVNTKATVWPRNGVPRRAGVSSFGMGGTNAHFVLEEPPALPNSVPSRPSHLLLISARTPEALETATLNLTRHLQKNTTLNLADVAYTLQCGRKAFRHRRALVYRDGEDAITALGQGRRRWMTRACDARERPVAFMFSGQGAQQVHMGAEIYQTEPVFREHLDYCATQLRTYLELDIREVLYPKAEAKDIAAKRLEQTCFAQPALFAIEYALAKLWMSWGVQPKAMIGHSLGEYVAACLAGVFDVETALSLVAARGRLMQGLPAGAMLSVRLAPEKLQAWLSSRLDLAAHNAPALCTVSGPTEAIEDLERRLKEAGVECSRLRVSHAFHSSMMDPVLEAFAQSVKKAAPKAPQIPFVSNVSGTWITAGQASDPDYWAQHLRRTVLFAAGLQALKNESSYALVEVGPGRTLATFASAGPSADTTVVTSLPSPVDAQAVSAHLLKSLGQLWLSGVTVDWRGLHSGENRRRIPLPTYPFERRRYWLESRARSRGAAAPRATTSIESSRQAKPSHAGESIPSPQIELEQRIAAVWEELLGVEGVSANDNFFELGGHSLLASQLLLRLRAACGVEFPMRYLFETQTLGELTQAIQNFGEQTVPSEHAPAPDLDAETVLPGEIDGTGMSCEHLHRRPSHLFLTGATGFLGAYLLHDLLHETDAVVHCLVRANDIQEASAKIRNNLAARLLWDERLRGRIQPVAGSLEQARFGLSDAQFDRLSETVDAIYHCGAWVNFTYPYRALKSANVLGTQEVLRLSTRTKLKPVHFISTLAIFQSSAYEGARQIKEEDELRSWRGLPGGYPQSKWVAEKLVLAARSRGVPVSIYRPGTVGGHSRTGDLNTKDIVWSMIMGCIQLGMAPDIEDLVLDLVPVDYVSKAIVHLSGKTGLTGRTFHFANANSLSWASLVDWFIALGYQLRRGSYAQWCAELLKTANHNPRHALLPFLPLLLEHQGGSTPDRPFSENHVRDRFCCSNAMGGLADSSIRCPSVDHDLLNLYLSRLIRAGSLPLPQPVD
jgi:thioester reductase-like protein